MRSLVASVFSPMLTLMVLMAGQGALMTLVPVRLAIAEVSTFEIGLVSTTYYVGMLLGAFGMTSFILRIGHIRAYATFASLLTVMTLMIGVFENPYLWAILRLVGGYALAGAYIVIESWMLSKSTNQNRGQLVAIYMVSLYGFFAGGQFLLGAYDLEALRPFCIIAIFSTLSILPLSMTRAPNPVIDEPNAFRINKLYKLSPTGVIGCMCGGMLQSVFYSLLPVVAEDITTQAMHIAIIMAATIFGGMALQIPIGKMSDMMDRRKVIIAISAISFVLNIVVYYTTDNFMLMCACLFIIGGCCFSIYSVSISHACDVIDSDHLISAAQGLLFAYCIGCVAGPIVATILWSFMPPISLFIYFSIVSASLVVFMGARMIKRTYNEDDAQPNFVAVTTTSTVMAELDPRQEEEGN